MPPTPALNNRFRREISSTMINLESVWTAKKGDPAREDLERVMVASMEPLLEFKKIELRYMHRMLTALHNKDTVQLMAAVYGLQIDMRGKPTSDDEFFRSMFMRSMRIATHNTISKWFDQSRISSFGSMRERRALVEFFEERLVELDAAVLQQYPPEPKDVSPVEDAPSGPKP